MKNLIAINLMVLVIIVLTSLTANAGIVKVNESLLINQPEICNHRSFCE
jgi:hypothetical protein